MLAKLEMCIRLGTITLLQKGNKQVKPGQYTSAVHAKSVVWYGFEKSPLTKMIKNTDGFF